MADNNLKFPNLFSPIMINKMMVKNRIMSAPLGSQTDKSLSGIGIIMKGSSGNVVGGRSRSGIRASFVVNSDGYVVREPLKGNGNRMKKDPLVDMAELAKIREEVTVIQQQGAKATFEVLHTGLYAAPNIDGDYAVGPCDLIREDGVEVKALNEDMMKQVCAEYVESCLIMRDLGFDMVTLHFCHGWLPSQFLSPKWNKREDDYGGSLENRIKFPTMIVDSVRKALGPDFPIDMRVSMSDYADDGIDSDDVVKFVESIQDKIDMVNISGGYLSDVGAVTKLSTSSLEKRNFFVHWAEKMKEKVRIPVGVVGAILTPEDAEEIIASGKADIVVIGRSLIADPFWVKKAKEGNEKDIVPCIRCLECWTTSKGVKSLMRCSVAPRYGRESRVPVELPKAEKTKHVAVVGGGPAGMMAAITASHRGHKVVLFEKTNMLGGQLCYADFDRYKADISRYKDYLVYQVEKAEIEVRLNSEVSPELLKGLGFDSLILAVGATPIIPKLVGVENENVILATDVFEKLNSIKGEVAIIGGGTVGCELALLLSEVGCNVKVIESTEKIMSNANAKYYHALSSKLREQTNIEILTSCTVNSIQNNKIEINLEDEIKVLNNDYVVISTGYAPNYDVINSFYGIVDEINVIGDSRRARSILEATEEGYFSAQWL